MNGSHGWLNDLAASLALAFGLTLSGLEFLGGISLAIAGSLIALKLNPARRQRSYWIAIVGGLFVAVLAAQGSQTDWAQQYIAGLPFPGIMGAAGFASSWLLRVAMGIGARAEKAVPERIFPGDKK